MMCLKRGTTILVRFGEWCRWMSVKRTVSMVVLFLAPVIQAGCSRVRYPTYYTLNLPGAPDPPASENARATLAIREFSAPTYLRQGPIVYKTSPDEVSFYAYHRWATDPREVVTTAVFDRLRAGGAFARVQLYDGRPDVGYVLRGRLEKLDEFDYDGGVKVEVALSAQMTNIATGATVWTNTVSEVGVVNKRDIPTVVSEMNLTMERAIGKLLSPIPVNVTGPTTAKGK
jgi:ABC-type uncharacterized transport system auxiliary subunit